MAEVLFDWEGRKVNLKLARATVRHLAEQHTRLSAVGPTQGLRDILQWLQTARANDSNYRALQARYATNADFPTVMDFLKAYDYEGMKRAYPKQSGSLWMATRGVLRKMTQAAESSAPPSPQPHIGGGGGGGIIKEEETAQVEVEYSAQSSAQFIKEGADDVAFETLMLLSNPHQLSQEDYLQLSQTHQTLKTVLGDLELLLRSFGGAAAAGIPGAGGGSGGGAGGDGASGSPGSTPPGSPYDFYPPSSPGGSSSSGGTDGGFSPGSGGNYKGAYTWYAAFLASKGETVALENKLASLSLSSAAAHGADLLTSKVAENAAQRTSESNIGIQDTMSRSGFDRSR